jgi:hypothetical protein
LLDSGFILRYKKVESFNFILIINPIWTEQKHTRIIKNSLFYRYQMCCLSSNKWLPWDYSKSLVYVRRKKRWNFDNYYYFPSYKDDRQHTNTLSECLAMWSSETHLVSGVVFISKKVFFFPERVFLAQRFIDKYFFLF